MIRRFSAGACDPLACGGLIDQTDQNPTLSGGLFHLDPRLGRLGSAEDQTDSSSKELRSSHEQHAGIITRLLAPDTGIERVWWWGAIANPGKAPLTFWVTERDGRPPNPYPDWRAPTRLGVCGLALRSRFVELSHHVVAAWRS